MNCEVLHPYEAAPREFINQIVTQDEMWVHHSDPELKSQSCQKKHPGSLPPKKHDVITSSGKAMPSLFWVSQKIIVIDYLEKGKPINGSYYSDELI